MPPHAKPHGAQHIGHRQQVVEDARLRIGGGIGWRITLAEAACVNRRDSEVLGQRIEIPRLASALSVAGQAMEEEQRWPRACPFEGDARAV